VVTTQPNYNSQESYHREEKRNGKLGLELGVYLETGLKRDLHRVSVDLSSDDIVLHAHGLPSRDVHQKAINLIQNSVTAGR
jgi:hypothetical protein